MDKLREKPDYSFVKAESDHADDRKNQKFDLLFGQSPSGKDPENTQDIIRQESEDKGDSG